MTRRFWIWPATLLLSTMAVGFLVLGDVNSWIRPILALWFLSVCPGTAFVRLLRIGDPWAELSLGIALSLALDTLAAAASLYLGTWSVSGVLAILMGLTVLGVALQIASSFRLVPRNAPHPGQ